MTDKWDQRFLDIARHIATWSKDRSTGVGCVIVGPDKTVLSIGYNGFPRGVNDDVDSRHERPAKYKWTEHAERNAIANAARTGTSLLDSTAYVPWFPCADCGRLLIQAGVKRLVCEAPDFDDPKWGDDFRIVKQMLEESGVEIAAQRGSKASACSHPC